MAGQLVFLQRRRVSPDGTGCSQEPDDQRPAAQAEDSVFMQLQTGWTSLQGGFWRGRQGVGEGKETIALSGDCRRGGT